jgi:hypothetical protein
VLGTSTLKDKTFGITENSGHVKFGFVWIVIKLLLDLVAEKSISKRKSIKNSTTNNTKGKETLVVPN